MGGAKRLMEEQQARYADGLAACVAVGAINQCKMHPGSYYEGSGDVEDALKLAGSDDERAAIQTAYDDNSGIDYCPSCDRYMRD